MPSFSQMKQLYKNTNSIADMVREQSNQIMEQTWSNDLQSRVCYIYDYLHDDQPDKKDHMTYEYTTKTRIDAKFVMKSHQSLDKDQTEYYLQFKPSQKLEFVPEDELYYYETDYRQKFWMQFPIGLIYSPLWQ